jgi:hypothetical protein
MNILNLKTKKEITVKPKNIALLKENQEFYELIMTNNEIYPISKVSAVNIINQINAYTYKNNLNVMVSINPVNLSLIVKEKNDRFYVLSNNYSDNINEDSYNNFIKSMKRKKVNLFEIAPNTLIVNLDQLNEFEKNNRKITLKLQGGIEMSYETRFPFRLLKRIEKLVKSSKDDLEI